MKSEKIKCSNLSARSQASRIMTLLGTVLTVKVLDFEDVGTSFSGSTDNLGCMDLHKALLLKELAEELGDTSLNAEDGLVGDGLLCS